MSCPAAAAARAPAARSRCLRVAQPTRLAVRPCASSSCGRRTSRLLRLVASASSSDDGSGSSSAQGAELDKEVSKFVKQTANTFAPRASGPTKKNPAYPGSLLYTIFEVQAYASIAIGGLLAFNVIYPTDEPSIPRLLGMWSVWMMAVPSLRARDCSKAEKDALNILFLAIPVVNVLIPFFWKSFAACFSADVVLMAALYAQKGAFSGGFDIEAECAAEAAAAAAAAAAEAEAPKDEAR